MKNTIVTLLGASLIFFSSCNRIDQTVVDKLQTTLNEIQGIKPEIEEATQNGANLRDQMKNAPLGLQINPEFGFMETVSKADSYNNKCKAIEKILEDMNGNLEGMMGDYVDGNVEKKAVLEKLDSCQNDIEGIKKMPERLAAFYDNMSAEYAKMSATYAALSEAEKQAILEKNNLSGISASGAVSTSGVSPTSTQAETKAAANRNATQQKGNTDRKQ